MRLMYEALRRLRTNARARAKRGSTPERYRKRMLWAMLFEADPAGRRKAWAAENRSRIAESARAWRARNPIKVAARNRRRKYARRARLRGACGSGWGEKHALAIQMWGGRCVYCGSDFNLTVDHLTPIARGGSNRACNLAPACARCNSSKGPRTVETWCPTRAKALRLTALLIALRVLFRG